MSIRAPTPMTFHRPRRRPRQVAEAGVAQATRTRPHFRPGAGEQGSAARLAEPFLAGPPGRAPAQACSLALLYARLCAECIRSSGELPRRVSASFQAAPRTQTGNAGWIAPRIVLGAGWPGVLSA